MKLSNYPSIHFIKMMVRERLEYAMDQSTIRGKHEVEVVLNIRVPEIRRTLRVIEGFIMENTTNENRINI